MLRASEEALEFGHPSSNAATQRPVFWFFQASREPRTLYAVSNTDMTEQPADRFGGNFASCGGYDLLTYPCRCGP